MDYKITKTRVYLQRLDKQQSPISDSFEIFKKNKRTILVKDLANKNQVFKLPIKKKTTFDLHRFWEMDSLVFNQKLVSAI